MTTITIGYHIQPEGLQSSERSTNPEELWRHLGRIRHRSGGHLVLNGVDYAIRAAKEQPNHIIFIRYHPDGKMHLKNQPEYKSPSDFVEMIEKDWNKCKAAGVTNVAFTTLNEPSTESAQAIVDWHTNIDKDGKVIPFKSEGVLDICARKGIPIAAMQLGISDWELSELEILVPVFRKISQHDGLFSVALHEYFGIVPSSGMPIVGSNDPEFVILDSAWSSQKAKEEWIKNGKPHFAIQPENWPTNPDERKYHVGRHQDVIDVCEKHNIPRLIIDIAEAGADDMNEGGQGFVGAWFRSIKVSAGFFNPRFWRSLDAQWATWYSKQGWNAQKAYWEMLKWLLLNVWTKPYKGKPRRIRSVIVFCWWSSGQIGSAEDWNPARVDNAYEFQAEHEKWVNQTTEPETPPEEPVPESRPAYAVIDSPTAVNVRREAGTNYSVVGQIRNGDKVLVEGVKMDAENVLWTKIHRKGSGLDLAITGWVSRRVARFEDLSYSVPSDSVVIRRSEHDALLADRAEKERLESQITGVKMCVEAIASEQTGTRDALDKALQGLQAPALALNDLTERLQKLSEEL